MEHQSSLMENKAHEDIIIKEKYHSQLLQI